VIDDLYAFLADPDAASVQRYTNRYAMERNLLGSVVADPVRGLAVAEAAGITDADFSDETYKAVWLAVVLKRQAGKLTGDRWSDRNAVLHLVKSYLIRTDAWHRGQTAELADMAAIHPGHQPRFIEVFARELRQAVDQMDALNHHLSGLRRVFASGPADSGLEDA
jgi:hypothetical protein